MSEKNTTVAADLVAAGVGLPPVWLESGEGFVEELESYGDEVPTLDLSDPQTAYGVALRLDEWERAGAPPAWAWAGEIAAHAAVWDRAGEILKALAVRVEHIGRDHRIRRAWGLPPKQGTLGELRLLNGAWDFTVPDHSDDSKYGEYNSPVTEDITDPTEALRAIDESLS